MNRIKLKETAKEQIRSNIDILCICSVIHFAVSRLLSLALSDFPVVRSITDSFLSAIFAVSLATIYLNLAKGQPPKVSDVLIGFYDWWSAFKTMFFISIFTCLWSLLLIIPGIIKGISYSMSLISTTPSRSVTKLRLNNPLPRKMNFKQSTRYHSYE